MPANLITYAFTAGELSPQLFGRSDYDKYDLGLAEALNFFVDYRGGVSTRPGTQFIDYLQYDQLPTRFFEFQFAPDIGNTYVLVFGDNYLRFVQNDGYVLEAAKTVTNVTQAATGVVTSAGHGFSNNDWVKISGVVGMTRLNSKTFWVRNVTANTFQLYDHTNTPVNTTLFSAYVSGGQVRRIYTVASPYAAEDLEHLEVHQVRNEVRLTCPGYAVRTLTRVDQTNWTLALEVFSVGSTGPTGLTLNPSGAGTAGMAVVVTWVDANGVESLPSFPRIETTSVNYTATAGSLEISWNPVAGAVSYNIYRSIVLADGALIHAGYELGYIGTSKVPNFVDSNIIPDFTRTPPIFTNPFANGQVQYVQVTAGGSGYDQNTATVAISGGTGFLGRPIVLNGEIVGVLILRPGTGYTTGSTVTFGGGTGATATVEVSALSGNEPYKSLINQQRQIYAATQNQPLTLFGSRPKDFKNFSASSIVTADDAYEFDLDSQEVTPIQHLISVRGGILVMTQSGVWLLQGGASGEAITPTNALADPQAYQGTSSTKPVTVDSDLLYVESVGSTVRLLGYNEYSEVYKGEDVSFLSNHLFSASKRIVRWGFAPDPFKVVWAVRSDGALLSFTIVKEQKVFGWTRHQTKGLFRDMISIREENTFGVYFAVERLLQGRYTKVIEKLAPRQYENVEDAWCVDCALQLPQVSPAASLSLSAADGTGVVATASANVFSVGDVGKVLRAGGGIGEVTAYTSPTQVTLTMVSPVTAVLPEDTSSTPLPILSGAWTLDAKVTTVSGLDHLEGQEVQILADGNVKPSQVVTDGQVTFLGGATKVVVGLGFTARVKSLSPFSPQAVIEARKKRIAGVALRKHETRGLRVGSTLGRLFEMKERTNELSGRPIPLQSGISEISIDSAYDEEGQFYAVQVYPLPATILGYVVDVEVGDED